LSAARQRAQRHGRELRGSSSSNTYLQNNNDLDTPARTSVDPAVAAASVIVGQMLGGLLRCGG
jgi:hypothetical protein